MPQFPFAFLRTLAIRSAGRPRVVVESWAQAALGVSCDGAVLAERPTGAADLCLDACPDDEVVVHVPQHTDLAILADNAARVATRGQLEGRLLVRALDVDIDKARGWIDVAAQGAVRCAVLEGQDVTVSAGSSLDVVRRLWGTRVTIECAHDARIAALYGNLTSLSSHHGSLTLGTLQGDSVLHAHGDISVVSALRGQATFVARGAGATIDVIMPVADDAAEAGPPIALAPRGKVIVRSADNKDMLLPVKPDGGGERRAIAYADSFENIHEQWIATAARRARVGKDLGWD